MAVLVDYSQVAISTLMVQIGNHTNIDIDENLLRHMILNVIRSNRMKFKDEFGELVLCMDDKNYWRKTVFPYYKAARKKGREKSELDWNAIFTALNKIREELKEFFPYKVIQVPTAEADDIIGTIIHHVGTELNSGGEKYLILSGDKDYIQLHRYANVQQYDPTRKRWIKHSNPDRYLFEHVIRGDAGDGVPNVLSPDNCLVVGERQKPITKKRLSMMENSSAVDEETRRNWARNRMLIDLNEVPTGIKAQILEEWEAVHDSSRGHLLNYFMKNRLRHLTQSITDF